MRYLKKLVVAMHKRKLARASMRFFSYPEVAFVFQTFNKSENMTMVLKPFIKQQVSNIIVFADGCIDRSAKVAHSLLSGRNHYVIQSNDTHEINNYRLSLSIAAEWGCSSVVLLQDDDIYSDNFFPWLDKCLVTMAEDQLIAIIGGNAGACYVGENCTRADTALTNANFEFWRDGGSTGFRLGRYQEMVFSNARADSVGVFVDMVNRSPQVIDVSTAQKLDFFPKVLEPYQYDDDYNCLAAWSNGYKVLHMPTDSKTGNFGVGGMRLYNQVTVQSRPEHFCRNWNFVLDTFGDFLRAPALSRLVAAANESRNGP